MTYSLGINESVLDQAYMCLNNRESVWIDLTCQSVPLDHAYRYPSSNESVTLCLVDRCLSNRECLKIDQAYLIDRESVTLKLAYRCLSNRCKKQRGVSQQKHKPFASLPLYKTGITTNIFMPYELVTC